MATYNGKLNTPSGFRDLLPEEASRRELIIDAITRVYKRFGFLPLETPVAEFQDVLISEGATDFNLFRLESTNQRLGTGEKEEVALRFDLTVPLARAVSQYGNTLARPFKRYQLGYVFRGERPQKGRYRQFMQFDADIVGTKNLTSDAEVIAMIAEIMKELQVSRFVIRVNTRTLLNILPTAISFPQNLLREVLIVLDKAEKISEEELETELRRLRMSEDGISKIKTFANIAGHGDGVIKKLQEFFAGVPEADAGIQELQSLQTYLDALGVLSYVRFDMKIIRGFAYYTGPVFETNLLDAPEFGSVVSGGRYDNLVERFTGQTLPAVGVSVGVDRLETALTTLGSLTQEKVLKCVVLGNDVPSYALRVASVLRRKMIVDVYSGTKTDFKEMFSYAEKVGATYAVVLGEQEASTDTVSIKNLATREQKTFSLAELTNLDINF